MPLKIIPPSNLTIVDEDGTRIVIDDPGQEELLLLTLIKARIAELAKENHEFAASNSLAKCNSFNRTFIGLICLGLKIDAIKFHREVFKSGLKEAKDAMEMAEKMLGSIFFHTDGSQNWPDAEVLGASKKS